MASCLTFLARVEYLKIRRLESCKNGSWKVLLKSETSVYATKSVRLLLLRTCWKPTHKKVLGCLCSGERARRSEYSQCVLIGYNFLFSVGLSEGPSVYPREY